MVKRWGGKKNTLWGKRKASRAGRAQRVIGFTGVSPAQPLALGANGAGLDVEECVRASAFLRVSSRVDRRRVQTSVHLLLLSAADAWKIGLRRRLFFFFFPRAGGGGGGGGTGNPTHSLPPSVASHSSGMVVLGGARCTIPVLGCILVLILCTSPSSTTCFLENAQEMRTLFLV